MKIGVFASFLMATAVSLYLWSPAKTTSAFDWAVTAGSDVYSASLSGSDSIRISATPSYNQQVFTADDTLRVNSTCPYASRITIQSASDSNTLTRIGDDSGIKTIAATTDLNLNDNSWGYSIDNGASYHAVPTINDEAAIIHQENGIATNVDFSISYGVKINSEIPSGYYSNTVVYSLETNENCAKYTLSFDTDGGSEIADEEMTYGQTVDLANYVTTKEDYDLVGWIINDVTYSANETGINPNPTDALNTTIKAVWEKSQTTFGGITTMQQMTAQLCRLEPTPLETATESTLKHSTDNTKVPTAILTDTRDGSTYTVKKLADGKCWMTDYLRLANKTITSEDSDLPANTSFNVLPSNISAFAHADNVNAVYIHEEHGGYYPYYTATAGWGTNSVAVNSTSPKSICPKGWRLPANSRGDYSGLLEKYNSPSLMRGTPNMVLNGYVYAGVLHGDGQRVGEWDASVNSAREAYILFGLADSVSAVTDGHFFDGLNIRCVADTNIDLFTISTMQEMTYEVCSNTTTPVPTATVYDIDGSYRGNTSYVPKKTLVDTRDNSTYTVSKLADGNCWMTQNLKIGGSEPITLHPSDSDIDEDFELPASSMAGSDFSAFDTKNVYIDSTYGGFYNWYTATAGEGTQAMSSGVTEQSICPKNWRMPTAGPSSEFYTLYTKYNTSALLRGTPGLTLAGLAGDGRIINPGSMGDVWGSNASSSERAYNFGLAPSAVYPNDDSVKTMGAQVRCIADERYYITLNAGEGTVSETRIKVSRGKTATLPTPTLNNHTFLGWYTEETDGEKIDPSKTEWTEDMTLYAHWQMNSMQNFTCSSLTSVGASKDLVDIRDGNMYTVKKLADGRCWMANSLKLGSNKSMTLTSADTDMERATFPLRRSDGSYSSTYGQSLYITSTYGGYYNWYTATAGDGLSSMTSGDASHSICPKGWKLPSTSEFSTLISKYNSASAIRGVPNFTLGGSTAFVDNIINFQGSSGDYWSSTVVNADNAYFLYISSGVSIANDYRHMGYQIRCVSRN